MPSLLHIRTGTTPVLDQEQHEVSPGFSEILGIHGPQNFVFFDPVVKSVDELNEKGLPTNLFEQRFIHPTTLMVALRMVLPVS
jgi:hypothetical protein